MKGIALKPLGVVIIADQKYIFDTVVREGFQS